MSDSHSTYDTGSIVLRGLVQIVITDIIMAVLLFWPAGTLSWPRAWWYLAIFTVAVVGAIIYAARVLPELFEARQGFKPGTKQWDVVVASASIVAIAAILPVAGFDERFGWLPVPDWLVVAGYALFAIGFWLALWAETVNRHFEMGVRIQTDRDHKVIDTGPYAHIRHPGYSGAVILSIGTALALGSIVALIPVAATAALLGYRTLREEETLRAELAGYAEFMTRTRYRWIPRLW
jgi:protein-S-isoprenylcysteine O-methyltransferase Ste14